MSFYYVYVIQSLKADWIYVGSTSDLRKRFKSHNDEENLSTNGYPASYSLKMLSNSKDVIFTYAGWNNPQKIVKLSVN